MPKGKGHIPIKDRRFVFLGANGRCEYCKSSPDYATESFENEHIILQAQGGSNDLNNLALACGGCNRHKQYRIKAKDPVDETLHPLFNPRTQEWNEHFAWSEDANLVIGLTPIGRATVAALRLNRPGLINLRRLLHGQGLHPPPD